MCISRQILFLHIHKILKHFLHQLILAKAINKVHTGFSSSNTDYPVYHVKILIDFQLIIQIIHIF